MPRAVRQLAVMNVAVRYIQSQYLLVATVDTDSLGRWSQLSGYSILDDGQLSTPRAGPRSIPNILAQYPGQLTGLSIKVIGPDDEHIGAGPGITITGIGGGTNCINLAKARSLLTKLLAACAYEGTRVVLAKTAVVPAVSSAVVTNPGNRKAVRIRKVNRRGYQRQPRRR